MSIELIVVDLDGTLLNSQHKLSEKTAKALQAAREQGVRLVLATGKTRASTVDLIAQLKLDTPGIFNQGLVTYNPDGSVRHQLTLSPDVARQAITFAEDRGFTMLAYAGSDLIARKRNHDTALLEEYGEPLVQEVGPLQNILDDMPINKVLAIHRADERRVQALRWQLGMQLNGSCRLVRAGVPCMIEVMPPGGSKGAALKVLLKDLKITPDKVLALGDGENDIEMIQQAGIGVAVANAMQAVKDAADYVVASNDEDGVAEAVERFVLKPESTSDQAVEVKKEA
jgi:Cof subfamily protein (haloacid dehalogenase superfamily)